MGNYWEGTLQSYEAPSEQYLILTAIAVQVFCTLLLEFLETFETHHSLRNNNAPDHIVTKEEFEEYYNNISASIDNDQYFELMMNNAWKINEGDRTYGKGWSNKDTSPSKNPQQSYGAKMGGGGGGVQSYSRPQTGYKGQGQSMAGYGGQK